MASEARRSSARLASQDATPYNRNIAAAASSSGNGAASSDSKKRPLSLAEQGLWNPARPPKLFKPEIQYGEAGEAGFIGMDHVTAVRLLKRLNPKLEIVTMPFGHAYKTRSGGGWFLRCPPLSSSSPAGGGGGGRSKVASRSQWKRAGPVQGLNGDSSTSVTSNESDVPLLGAPTHAKSAQ